MGGPAPPSSTAVDTPASASPCSETPIQASSRSRAPYAELRPPLLRSLFPFIVAFPAPSIPCVEEDATEQPVQTRRANPPSRRVGDSV